jgi:hypothetical protein
LPAAGRRKSGVFKGVGIDTGLWSRSAGDVYGRFLAVYGSGSSFHSITRGFAYSIRCIKD